MLNFFIFLIPLIFHVLYVLHKMEFYLFLSENWIVLIFNTPDGIQSLNIVKRSSDFQA